jgi:hypothetical protein
MSVGLSGNVTTTSASREPPGNSASLEDGFQTFDVLEVQRWAGASAARAGVTGSGIYRRGRIPGYQQQLELDLRLDNEQRHYTSGRAEWTGLVWRFRSRRT